MGKLRVDYTMGVDSMGAMDDGDEEITSIFVVSLHSVQDAQQGVALMMVIMLQLFLQLFGLNIGTTSFAKVHEISFEIWLRTASQANVSSLTQATIASTAVAPKSVALGSGIIRWLVIMPQIFDCNPVPLAQQQHTVLLI